MKNSTKYVLVAAVALIVGIVAGGTLSAWLLAGPQLYMSDMGRVHMLGQFAQGQYTQAEYPNSKKGLEQYLAFLDQYDIGRDSWLSEETLHFEKLMCHARLAILEEGQQHDSLAAEHWRAATEAAGMTHWKNRSVYHIREVVLKTGKP